MGAWGEGPFDNDSAADWAGEFEDDDQASGLARIRQALSEVVQSDEYIDSDIGDAAVAAAALLAAILGRPLERSPYNEIALNWIARSRPSAPAALIELARQALARVLGPDSELAELWDQSGPSWRAGIDQLLAGLVT